MKNHAPAAIAAAALFALALFALALGAPPVFTDTAPAADKAGGKIEALAKNPPFTVIVIKR